MIEDIGRVGRNAVFAEVAWLESDGLHWDLLTPLEAAGRLVFALPYAVADQAQRIAIAESAVVTMTDGRLSGPRWQPMGASVRFRLFHDHEGKRFVEELLQQELTKFPPSRGYLDSRMLRKENWWLVPRVILEVDHVDRQRELVARSDRSDGVIAWIEEGLVDFDAARMTGREGNKAFLASLTFRSYPEQAQAAFFRHDSIIPELEEREGEVLAGTLRGESLEVARTDAWGNARRRRTLRERWRSQQALERGCRQGLKDFAD